MRARFAIAAAILGACGCVLIAAAQSLSPGEVRLSSRPYEPRPLLRAVSRLVELEVVVRDARGIAVPGLTKDDFAVFDSGKVRDLSAFSVSILNPPAGSNAAKLAKAGESSSLATSSNIASQPQASGAAPARDRWIVLHFDDINTAVGDLAHAKIASKRFVNEALGNGDRIAVFTTSAGRVLDFTGDTSAVLASIAKVQAHQRMSPSGISSCPRITPYEAYRIVNNDPTALTMKITEACRCGGTDPTNGLCMTVEQLPPGEPLSPTFQNGAGAGIIESVQSQAQQTWDLALQVSQLTMQAIQEDLDALSQKPGNRVLLLASSGFLSGELEEKQDAIIDHAVRAGIIINSLDAKGLYAEAPGGPINETQELTDIPVSSTVFQIESLGDRLDSVDSSMARFAEGTGGLLFRNNNDLDLGFRQLGLVPACTYLVGFTPAEDGKYHKIKVELRNKAREFAQVRPGYFAPAPGAAEQPAPVDQMDALMSGTDEKTDLPATISEKLGTAKSGGPEIIVQTHVDIQKLAFEEKEDRQVQKLTFVAAIFNPQGNFITGKEAEMDLALKPESFERFSKSGISGVMQLEAPSGAYRLRVVVQEALHGNLFATSKMLQVP
ncbi:MAG: VWA domain-containing protein [Candidatus Acidiferrum sp.]